MNALFQYLKRAWPASLFARLALVWLAALLVGHLVENVYGYLAVYDEQIARTDYYLSQDLVTFLPLLETATPVERAVWIAKMQRKTYRYQLGRPASLTPASGASSAPPRRTLRIIDSIGRELHGTYRIESSPAQKADEQVRLQLLLKDGSLLQIQVLKPIRPIDWWSGLVFALQVLAVIAFTWLAVRQATRPLARLAEAAEALGSSLRCEAIAEDGPSEVARAAAAFNAMQRRITEHLAERVQILAAISHDLQTPITRMRLRADLMDSGQLRDKLQNDLNAMQVLVEEGISYARSAQRVTEKICRLDLDALLDSLVCDYVDAEQVVRLHGEIQNIIQTRPNTLKRILINLVDNALKFAGEPEIQVSQTAANTIEILVLDRGPGIPEDEIASVLQPFYRIENSRNRDTGGTGLGLAIAQQLAHALSGSISLKNREGGGLEAKLIFAAKLAS